MSQRRYSWVKVETPGNGDPWPVCPACAHNLNVETDADEDGAYIVGWYCVNEDNHEDMQPDV